MNNEPIEAQEVQYLTFDELLELSLQEFKKSLGPLPKTGEANPSSTSIDANDNTVPGDQPTELTTNNTEAKGENK